MWEYVPHMNRVFTCFSVLFLLCCAAAAQNPAPAPATPAQSGAPASAAPRSGVMATQSPEIAQFQKIEDAWATAVNQHDQYGLENVLSPLFMDVAANGDITTRNQQVVQVIAGEDKTENLAQRVITVRMLGDIAVANGTYTLHHKVNNAEVDEKGVFTHVFERVRNGWACINSQRTLVHEDTKSNTKAKKPSTAEEPFHIPLFSK
jgi:ketosteroid isomerase-like protein